MEAASNSTWNNKSIHIIAPRAAVGSFTESAVFFRILFVLLLRIGLILLQIGSIPAENVYKILLQNILDIGVSLASYGFIGFTINYGSKSLEGFLGYGAWINSDPDEISLHQAGYGFAAVLVGTGIITTVLCTRVHMLAAAVASFFYSAILYPVVAHWLRVGHGWMQQRKTIVKDYAGGLSVHTTASTFAAVGAMLLGRRLLRLSDISEISIIGAEVSKNTVAGYMFVMIGLIVFSLPTPEEEFRLKHARFDGMLFSNSVLALSAAGLINILLDVSINCKQSITYWPLLKYLQAAIAGVVSLSCGVDSFSPITAFGAGLFTGIAFFFTATAIHHSFIEDNCNVIASSLVSSFLASLLSQLVSKNDVLQAIFWQILSHLTICVFSFISALLVLLLFYTSNRFKSRSEIVNHERATVAYKGKSGSSFRKLFSISRGAGYVEPGTSKVNIGNNGISDKNFMQKTTESSTGTDWKERPTTPVSSSDYGSNISKRSLKREINIQESSLKLG